ncbi:hypothetical protein ETB97_006984 [Aspergillus alliaceus]|uniref:Uncharacterized protein n=1 Tax=Petromyces alliaceus TaxID=209559 RepID=A0A8H5ZX56_PETAA|nr:hypothetical protein ETB97_006984 [Aspergillus burnettii]
MGVDTRRPILPAPTESIVDTTTTGGSVTGTDLATDVSRRTDKSSYSVPDDGSPVTISTRRKHRTHRDDSKLSRSAQHSQTSLLIEYFEGGKGSGSLISRPSVRVRVTPSSSRKRKDSKDHIQVTESHGNRKPVYSRRISFSSPSKNKSSDDYSICSFNSGTDENQQPSGHTPVEIELVNRDQSSEISSDARYFQPTSDISSMPADSMLEASSSGVRRKRSQSTSREREHSPEYKDYLQTPRRQRSRSLSTERIAHRVAEKLSNDPREHTKGQRNRGDVAEFPETDPKSSRSRLSAYPDEDMSPDPSLLSASALSAHRKSGDQYSFRSGTSKSSINNPKLLETVEDAIRRLILPELKELKKDQKVISNTSKFERDMNASYSSASTPSRDELGRRLSKHASAPDVKRPTVVLNKDGQDEGIVLSGEPAPSQPERRPSKGSDAPSETSYVKWGLRPELTDHEKLRRQRSKGLRDAEKAARVGSALTAAALKHHDSRSSIDKSERRRPNGPRSRNGSYNETELAFQKHNVAPMPLRSAIESDITRDSLLSEQTAREDSVLHDSRYRSQDSLGSPYELKHSNFSSHDLSLHDPLEQDDREQSFSPVGDAAAGAIAAAAAANLLDEHSGRHGSKFTDRRRTLSPIQSVASNQSESHIKQDSAQPVEHEFSGMEKGMEQRLSIDSLSSAPSTNLARSTRPHGISPASQKDILRHNHKNGPELGYESSPAMSPRSMTETASTDPKRMTGFTDDSEVSYIEKVNQRQPVAGIGANPQFIHPVAVESAVASILDPSIVEAKSNQSAVNHSQTDLSQRLDNQTPKPAVEKANQTPHGSRQGSPLKQRQDASSPDATSFPRRMGATSPPQSVTQSLEDQADPTHMFSEDIHDRESPSPEADRSPDSESEINTNPSIIQGPIGGGGNWAYEQTPDNRGQSPLFDNTRSAAGNTDLGLGPMDQPDYGHDYYATNDYRPDDYFDHQYSRGQLLDTPPGAKDEGYVSAANPLSPGVDTPEPMDNGFGGMDTKGMGLFDSPTGADDQFVPGHQRQLSGYSHGAGSPLYDSATGKGIDRIQSKDIVALMDHLTVRDAQRNARDTEILVTLVRSAAEMRNSFEEMKKFIAQQDGMLMEASDRQHDRTYRALGGPRPLPTSTRSARQPSVDDGEDLRSKRKNVFKRALKGLSLKSSNDLSRIEDMLEQLLDEVEALRDGQDERLGRSATRTASVDPEGYEPEGHAGTSSPDHSGYLLPTSSRPIPEPRGNGLRRDSEHRVSTVPEADEEMDINERGEFLSPNLATFDNADARQDRAGPPSASTPPRAPMASGALSNETSPKTNEKAKKHKSSSSSFFPKISRWSKTTASSMGDNIRNSIQPGRKERPSFDASRSGSDVQGPYKAADWYDPQGDDRLRSTFTLEDRQQENRPPSPLVPSQVSEAPKYRAHRESLDLQHPQPRQGPTGRYQSQLETQAQIYGMPSGAPSDQWGSNPSLSGVTPNVRRSSGASRLSPISDTGYSEASSRHTGPPRPPKIKDDGPLIPERPPKVKEDDERSYVNRVASRSSAMRSSPRSTPPPRKPTGPRPLNSGSQYSSPGRRKRSQYRASPDQVDEESLY